MRMAPVRNKTKQGFIIWLKHGNSYVVCMTIHQLVVKPVNYRLLNTHMNVVSMTPPICFCSRVLKPIVVSRNTQPNFGRACVRERGRVWGSSLTATVFPTVSKVSYASNYAKLLILISSKVLTCEKIFPGTEKWGILKNIVILNQAVNLFVSVFLAFLVCM